MDNHALTCSTVEIGSELSQSDVILASIGPSRLYIEPYGSCSFSFMQNNDQRWKNVKASVEVTESSERRPSRDSDHPESFHTTISTRNGKAKIVGQIIGTGYDTRISTKIEREEKDWLVVTLSNTTAFYLFYNITIERWI